MPIVSSGNIAFFDIKYVTYKNAGTLNEGMPCRQLLYKMSTNFGC